MDKDKDIKIRSISLKSYKGFDDVAIDCSKEGTSNEVFQWTVLLGNNNTGKTRILQAIADMRPIKWIDGKGDDIIVPAFWNKFTKYPEFARNYVLFNTKDGWFRYTELGYGYQSMLSWVVDLCKRMFETFPNSDNPLQESAVVLVDEIDLHLHPKWQREVISNLSQIFKNVQFIVTTHSPLIIQSMQEVNLYVLRREDEKIVVEHSPVTNFSGWTVEEILSETMNLGSDIQSIYLQESYFMNTKLSMNWNPI